VGIDGLLNTFKRSIPKRNTNSKLRHRELYFGANPPKNPNPIIMKIKHPFQKVVLELNIRVLLCLAPCLRFFIKPG
jgi:hypothetical protein